MRFSAWHSVFSSQHNTSDLSGGSRLSPTTSQNLSSNFLFCDTLKVRSRCGPSGAAPRCAPRHGPKSQASEPANGCSTGAGRAAPARLLDTRGTVASGIDGLTPRLGLSRRPSSPCRSKCCEHLLTLGALTPSVALPMRRSAAGGGASQAAGELGDIDDLYGDRILDVDCDDAGRRDCVRSGVNEGLEHGEPERTGRIQRARQVSRAYRPAARPSGERRVEVPFSGSGEGRARIRHTRRTRDA